MLLKPGNYDVNSVNIIQEKKSVHAQEQTHKWAGAYSLHKFHSVFHNYSKKLPVKYNIFQPL